MTYCVTIFPSGHVVYASNVYELFSKHDQICISKLPLKAGCCPASGASILTSICCRLGSTVR
jgi:hypothetical protein